METFNSNSLLKASLRELSGSPTCSLNLYGEVAQAFYSLENSSFFYHLPCPQEVSLSAAGPFSLAIDNILLMRKTEVLRIFAVSTKLLLPFLTGSTCLLLDSHGRPWCLFHSSSAPRFVYGAKPRTSKTSINDGTVLLVLTIFFMFDQLVFYYTYYYTRYVEISSNFAQLVKSYKLLIIVGTGSAKREIYPYMYKLEKLV